MPRLAPLALAAALAALPMAAAAQSCGESTVARDGDSFMSIARRCGADLKDLFVLNPGVNPADVGGGRRIVLGGRRGGGSDALAAAYVANVVGRWGPTAGECSDAAWTFAAGSVSGDRETFDILGFDGTPDDMRIIARNRNSGEPVTLQVKPSGDRLTVTGGGTLGSLRRC